MLSAEERAPGLESLLAYRKQCAKRTVRNEQRRHDWARCASARNTPPFRPISPHVRAYCVWGWHRHLALFIPALSIRVIAGPGLLFATVALRALLSHLYHSRNDVARKWPSRRGPTNGRHARRGFVSFRPAIPRSMGIMPFSILCFYLFCAFLFCSVYCELHKKGTSQTQSKREREGMEMK